MSAAFTLLADTPAGAGPRFDLEYEAMPLSLDPVRTALLLLDYQHDNITATPGIAPARVLEHSARVLEAAPRRRLRVIHITASVRRDYLDMPRASSPATTPGTTSSR